MFVRKSLKSVDRSSCDRTVSGLVGNVQCLLISTVRESKNEPFDSTPNVFLPDCKYEWVGERLEYDENI